MDVNKDEYLKFTQSSVMQEILNFLYIRKQTLMQLMTDDKQNLEFYLGQIKLIRDFTDYLVNGIRSNFTNDKVEVNINFVNDLTSIITDNYNNKLFKL